MYFLHVLAVILRFCYVYLHTLCSFKIYTLLISWLTQVLSINDTFLPVLAPLKIVFSSNLDNRFIAFHIILTDERHRVPISQMGNYQEVLKKQPPQLRELESTPARLHMFGNPFKVNKQVSLLCASVFNMRQQFKLWDYQVSGWHDNIVAVQILWDWLVCSCTVGDHGDDRCRCHD